MRKYSIQNWERAVDLLAQLGAKKKYAERFRLEYFQHLSYATSIRKKVSSFFQNLLSFINIYKFLLVNQVFAKRTELTDYKFIVFISNNPSFIKTVSPVIKLLLEKGEKSLILCGGNHYKALKMLLPESIFQHVHICESIAVSGRFISFLRLLGIPFLAVKDSIWFAFQPLQNALSATSNFARYSLVHHYFSKFLTEQFNRKKYTLIGAVDYWFWESLYFTAAKSTSSKSIVLQHGKLSDLYYPLFAKQFYAWGEADLVEMTEIYKADPDEIILAGSPYFDNIFLDIKQMANAEFLTQRKSITYFSQPYSQHKSLAPESYKEIISWLSEIKKQYPNLAINLKLHPYDNRNNYSENLKNIEIIETDMMATLKQTKIMLTADSTSALEAAMAQIPVIQCLPKSQNIYGDMSETGLTLKAETQEELYHLINKLLTDKAFFEQTIYAPNQALNYYFYNLGHSLKTIAEHLGLEKNQ